MGCCGSTPEEAPIAELASVDEIKAEIAAEQEAEGGKESFLGSILRAVNDHSDDPKIMLDAATRLQEQCRRLKNYVAYLDASEARQAMSGVGCNDKKLIAALCTRTKSQLGRTAKKYREMYDRDLRKDAKSETGGNYGKLVYYALASREQYAAEMIDLACGGIGCNETVLVELFASCTHAELRAGKKAWEGKHDRSVIDYLNKEVGKGRHDALRKLLLKLMKGAGPKKGAAAPDEGVAKEQAAKIKASSNEAEIVDVIAANSLKENEMLSSAYEDEYDESLGRALESRVKDAKLLMLLNALCAAT